MAHTVQGSIYASGSTQESDSVASAILKNIKFVLLQLGLLDQRQQLCVIFG